MFERNLKAPRSASSASSNRPWELKTLPKLPSAVIMEENKNQR